MEARTTAGKAELLPLEVKTEEAGTLVTTATALASREVTGTTTNDEPKRLSEAGMSPLFWRYGTTSSTRFRYQRGLRECYPEQLARLRSCTED